MRLPMDGKLQLAMLTKNRPGTLKSPLRRTSIYPAQNHSPTSRSLSAMTELPPRLNCVTCVSLCSLDGLQDKADAGSTPKRLCVQTCYKIGTLSSCGASPMELCHRRASPA